MLIDTDQMLNKFLQNETFSSFLSFVLFFQKAGSYLYHIISFRNYMAKNKIILPKASANV